MKTVLVTGASAGFGKAICQRLIASGYQVIGAARRADRLATLHAELGDRFLPFTLDVTQADQVDSLLDRLPDAFKTIDVLINNAGLALGVEPADQADFADWEQMITTNVLGLTHVTQRILPSMVARRSGFIINLGSIAGRYPYKGGNVYGATKAFVRQFSLNLRTDLLGTPIKVTNIEPGLCSGTEFSYVRFQQDEARVQALYQDVAAITADDIANTVLWLLQQPPHLNINTIEMMPVAQAPGGLAVDKTVVL